MNEEIKTERKQWQKPELIVLVRNKPEEVVLTACKKTGASGPSQFFCDGFGQGVACSKVANS